MLYEYVESGEAQFSQGTLENLEVNDDGYLRLSESAVVYRRPIYLNHMQGTIRKENYPISLDIDTADMIANGKLRPDAADLVFYDSERYKHEYTIYRLPINVLAHTTGNYRMEISITDTDILNHMTLNGRDLRLFYSETTTPYSQSENKVPFEIVSISSSLLKLLIYVTLTGDETRTIQLYYGNPTVGMESFDPSAGSEVFIECSSFEFEYDGVTPIPAYSNDKNFGDGLLSPWALYQNLGYSYGSWGLEGHDEVIQLVVHSASVYNKDGGRVFGLPYPSAYGIWEYEFQCDRTANPTSPVLIQFNFIVNGSSYTSDGYFVEFKQDNTFKLYRRLAGQLITLGSSTWNVDDKLYHTLRIERTLDNRIKVIYDDVVVINVVDNLIMSATNTMVTVYGAFYALYDTWFKSFEIDTLEYATTGTWLIKNGMVWEQGEDICLSDINNPVAYFNFDYELSEYIVDVKFKLPTFSTTGNVTIGLCDLNVTTQSGFYINNAYHVYKNGVDSGVVLTPGEWYVLRMVVLDDNFFWELYKNNVLVTSYIKGSSAGTIKRLFVSCDGNTASPVYVRHVRFDEYIKAIPGYSIEEEVLVENYEYEYNPTGPDSITEIENICILGDVDTSATKFFMRVPEIMPATIRVLYMDYAQPTRVRPRIDPQYFFSFWDDFDAGSLNTDKWVAEVVSGSWSGYEGSHLEFGTSEVRMIASNAITGGFIRLRTKPLDALNYGKKIIVKSKCPGTTSHTFSGGFATLAYSLHDYLRASNTYVGATIDTINSANKVNSYPFTDWTVAEIAWDRYGRVCKIENEVILSNLTEYATPSIVEFTLQGVWNNAYTSYIDWIAVVDYAYPDPIITYGTEIEITTYNTTGVRTTPTINISTIENVMNSEVYWEVSNTDYGDVTFQTNLSYDGGVTWEGWLTATKNAPIPGLLPLKDYPNARLKVRMTFDSSDIESTPVLEFFSVGIETEPRVVYGGSDVDAEPDIIDIETEDDRGYFETTKIYELDTGAITDRYALWQAVSGALKTPRGSLKVAGMRNYGCSIWELLGTLMTDLAYKQAELYVHETCKDFKEILDSKIDWNTEADPGTLSFRLTLDTIYGPCSGDVLIE